MADNDPCYSIRSRTLRVNASNAREAAILAMDRGGDFFFPSDSRQMWGEEERQQADGEQNRLFQEVPSSHEPGGYVVNVTRWAILNDTGNEVDADYLVVGVEDRQPHFSTPDIVSKTDAYLSWVSEGKMDADLPGPSDTNKPAPKAKHRL